MKGYELMKEIAEGKIKEGTKLRFKDNIFYFDGKNFINTSSIVDSKYMTDSLDDLEYATSDFEILQEPKKRWRAEKEVEEYYSICENCIETWYDYYDDEDNFRYKTYNYFQTREQAQAHLDNINTYYELKALAEELNGDEKIDWENENQIKYRIVYDYNMKNLTWSSTVRNKEIGAIYFLTRDLLEKAKSRIGEDRLVKLFGGVK